MTDCPNADMRDRLPDLLHERLDASARAVVMAHVAECDDCRAELVLLREARVVLSSGVRSVDVASIARVVVARAQVPAARTTRGRSWADWRIAAAVAFIAVGASIVAIRAVRQRGVVAPPAETAAVIAPMTPGAPVVGQTTRLVAPPATHEQKPAAALAASAELSAAGGVSDLSDNDLKALLNDLEKMDAVPPLDPEPVNVRVAPGRGSSE
jgi:anti-sigma factor RsiW